MSLHGIDETEGQVLVHALHLHQLLGCNSVKGFGVGVARGGKPISQGGIQALDLQGLQERGGGGGGLLLGGGDGLGNGQGGLRRLRP